MANFLRIALKEIELEREYMKDVLRCFLHTIIFNRTLGAVTPREMEIDALDLTYVRVDVRDHTRSDLDRAVDLAIDQLCRIFDAQLSVSAVITLTFSTKEESRGWFYSKEEIKVFEQWLIPVRRKPDAYDETEKADRRATLTSAVRDRMLFILYRVNLRKDHLPPVPLPPADPTYNYSLSTHLSSDPTIRDFIH
eukprot:gnl/Spiro4/25215_TR12547_c0_g1_i1.p1 gnl/Spiro4/25215_TR12547_c0_g1~~gnl/Spiro4/25215_TR12547_c0_g1_i1.p1  ORF type:complete len:216 (-),score=59.58 gnl/Spiro4/25215_TR12547_c0_g1_i1:85-666(-)